MVEGAADLVQISASRSGVSSSPAKQHRPSVLARQFGIAKIRVQLPRGSPASILTLRHPEMVLVVVSEQSAIDGKILLEVDVIDSQPVDFARELSRLPGVASVCRIGARQSRARFRVVAEPPRHLTAAITLGVVYRYPLVVRDGQCTLVLEAEISGLRRLLRELRRICPEVKLMSWGRENIPTFPPALSSRQQALLYQAIATGYFEVPRRITLTGLASQIRRSKSSVSRALSLIENRIVEASVLPTTGPEIRTGSRFSQAPKLRR